MNWAIEHDYAESNVAEKIKPPTKEQRATALWPTQR